MVEIHTLLLNYKDCYWCMQLNCTSIHVVLLAIIFFYVFKTYIRLLTLFSVKITIIYISTKVSAVGKKLKCV